MSSGVRGASGLAPLIAASTTTGSVSAASPAGHGRADGFTTWPTVPAFVDSPSTRIGAPFTTTCCMPTGASAVSRSAPAGKSLTRRMGPGATVAGSNTATSAKAPGRR